jgi:hypothetical protein
MNLDFWYHFRFLKKQLAVAGPLGSLSEAAKPSLTSWNGSEVLKLITGQPARGTQAPEGNLCCNVGWTVCVISLRLIARPAAWHEA